MESPARTCCASTRRQTWTAAAISIARSLRKWRGEEVDGAARAPQTEGGHKKYVNFRDLRGE